MTASTLKTPIGEIKIVVSDSTLQAIDFHAIEAKNSEKNGLLDLIKKQLNAYFEDSQVNFDIPLSTGGTAFQQRVWAALLKIPPGHTKSYGELAKSLQSSPRAVGNACRRNPIPIVIPCHRVVSSSGIGGFAGSTEGEHIRIKQWLLAHEGVQV